MSRADFAELHPLLPGATQMRGMMGMSTRAAFVEADLLAVRDVAAAHCNEPHLTSEAPFHAGA